MNSLTRQSTAVSADELRVQRGGREVLHGLSFEIGAGMITGLLGPSGGGKSTLLRAIVGVQAGVEGRLDVLGRPAGDAELRRHIGYVTQSPSVYADLTVERNLRYFAAIVGVGDERVREVIDEVDLAGAAGQRVETLSGGQRARVSLAAALLGRPDLLVLDEPTVGLDPVLRRDLWALFHRLAEAGSTLIVSSHVMDEAQRCDRLLLLRDGRLVADDTLDGLLRRTGAADVESAFLSVAERQAA
jgi:ABC-2 type transport system ATP-binding protein